MKHRLGVVLGVVVMATASGAAAARIPAADINYQATGGIDYTWVGVPARNCAAEGVCGVEGSLQVIADGSSGGGSGQPQVTLEDDAAVARVEYPTIGTEPERVCVDPVPYSVGFALRPAHGRGTSPVGAPVAFTEASSGQCAGPTASDLNTLRLPVRRERNGDYSLAGTESFGAGPFDVQAVSYLGVRLSDQNDGGSIGVSPPGRHPRPKERRVLVEQATISYRLVAVHGTMVDTFAGGAAPLCDPLASCGTSGSIRIELGARKQTFVVGGQRLVKRRVGLRAALEALRAGRLGLADNALGLAASAKTTAAVAGPGPTRCTGAVSNLVEFYSQPTRSADVLYLEQSGPDALFGGADLFRTRCPGPDSETILGQGALGVAALDFAALGAPRIRLTMQNPGRFDGPGYKGSRSGSVVLRFVRTRVTGGTRRENEVDGQVFP